MNDELLRPGPKKDIPEQTNLYQRTNFILKILDFLDEEMPKLRERYADQKEELTSLIEGGAQQIMFATQFLYPDQWKINAKKINPPEVRLRKGQSIGLEQDLEDITLRPKDDHQFSYEKTQPIFEGVVEAKAKIEETEEKIPVTLILGIRLIQTDGTQTDVFFKNSFVDETQNVLDGSKSGVVIKEGEQLTFYPFTSEKIDTPRTVWLRQ